MSFIGKLLSKLPSVLPSVLGYLGIGYTAPASGDTTGSIDTALIQSKLDAGWIVRLQKNTTYYTSDPILMPDQGTIQFGSNAVLKRRNSFTVSCTTTSGSANITYTGSHPEIKQYCQVIGTGIPDGCRADAVTAGSFTLSQNATASGTVTLTFYAGHNILYANQKTGYSLVCKEGWGYLDCNRANQSPYIKAIHDANGSGFRFESCTKWHMDGIWSLDAQYHGGFITSDETAPVNGSLGITIGRFSASGCNVRGLHARSSGTASVWPGMADVMIDTLYLQNNGQVHANHGTNYDLKNGGCFIEVAGSRRIDIKTLIVTDDLGQGLQVFGDDNSTDPNVISKNCHIGVAYIHNCAQGTEIGHGMQSFMIDNILVTCDRLYASTGCSTATSTLAELRRPDLSSNTINYMAVGTVTLPSSWTAAQIAAINTGDLLQTSISGTGVDTYGCVVISVNAGAKTALCFCLIDPLGIYSESVNSLITSITPGGAGAITLNGGSTSGGVSNYTNARKLQLVTAGDLSARTFTFVGTDYTGAALTEILSGPNNGTLNTFHLFKTVTSISVDAACGAALTVGLCLARPFNLTASNQPIMWRAGRDSGITFANNYSPSICGDVNHIHIGSAHIEGMGGYCLVAYATPVLGSTTKTYKDITIGKFSAVECMQGPVINSAQDWKINTYSVEDVGRGVGGDSAIHMEWRNSSSAVIGSVTQRWVTANYSFSGVCLQVNSDSSDINFGPSMLSTTGTVYCTFNGADVVITRPKKASDYSSLSIPGGQITGNGSPNVIVPGLPAPDVFVTKSADASFGPNDANKTWIHGSASAHTFTVPTIASTPFVPGTNVGIENPSGMGVITIAVTTDVLYWWNGITILTGSRTLAAGGDAKLKYLGTVGANKGWRITGNGIT